MKEMSLAGSVARIRKKKELAFFSGNSEGKLPLRRSRSR
jgi:hypothetical protein